MNEAIQRNYQNVREDWTIHDTVVIHSIYGQTPKNPGWFQSYAALATVNEINFFNVRNRTIGLFWNDQDARDVMPYGFYLKSIGVRFWAPATNTLYLSDASVFDHTSHHTFVCDVPWHLYGVLQVQQDEVLKVNSAMLPSGMGFFGDGVGGGSPILPGGEQTIAGIGGHHDSFTQGMPQLQNRWVWPVEVQIPKRANIGFKLVLNEYIRSVLLQMNNWTCPSEEGAAGIKVFNGISGIQVTLKGERLAQQRGEQHA